MAAVYGHAIRKLADIEFAHANKLRKSDKAQAERLMHIARELYGYLWQHHAGDSAVSENLGLICYWQGDYRQARSLLEQGTSAQAMYYCGRMYQYGDGTAQDLEKAKE
jgi:Sel1 repeat.